MNVRIVRIPAPSGFTQVPNASLRDERLSYKARGIHANLLSNSDEGWTETAETLAEKSPDGRHAVRTGLQELARLGYITYRKSQGPDGKWSTDMIVHTSPESENLLPVRPAETPMNPQVAPESENLTSVKPSTGVRKPASGATWEDVASPQVAPEAGFPNAGKPDSKQKTTTEEPEGHKQAGPRAPIPDWALPLVHRLHGAGLPGIRWNLIGDDWFMLHSLIQRKGIEAMADYATRVAASSAKPVFSARYFLPGWKELTDAPPAGNGVPALRAVSGGVRPLTGTDATVAGWLALGTPNDQEQR